MSFGIKNLKSSTMAFCKSLRIKIKGLLRQFDSYLERNVDTALKVTTALKYFLDSPIAQILTAVIPTDVDEIIRKKVVYGLSIAVDTLNVVDACKGTQGMEEKVQCFLSEIRKREPALQDAILHKVASIITATLDDNKKSQHVYDLLVQATFSAKK